VKKFYSIKLKYFKEQIPMTLAQNLLKDESPLIKYLSANGALAFRFWPSNNTLNLYGDEKHLVIGKMMYPEMFPDKGRIGFMELYISHILKKKLEKLEKIKK